MATTNQAPKASLKWRLLPVLLVVLVLSLGGCTSDRIAHADSIASTAGLRREQIKTDTFLLTTYAKITDKSQPFDIYIEGDGRAWATPTQPSLNPTPHKALALSLAALDPSNNVIYIARPCQFTPMRLDSNCRTEYWTERRFSEEVIASVNQAIDRLTGPAKSKKLNLIGYSGGGAVAVLVAARRNDVLSIRTVAGNLDHAESTRQHDATPLMGSLNPINQARNVAMIPQIHFSGQNDEIIPPTIAEKFFSASAPTTCITLRIIESTGHETGWSERWQELLKDRPTCYTSKED